ncbi:VTT domain-containing protein [Candidatus Micrarchaeota archaeon]|nr:VTT domain-containing protein [Candidatus Micrarchaeota archaeon]
MVEELLLSLGYLGAFLAGMISSVSLFLPLPGFIVVFLLGSQLNPIGVGVLGGLGAAIGELTGYLIGLGGQKLATLKNKKRAKWLNRIERAFQKYHPGAIIFAFAATPLPFDFIGIFCGATGYPAKHFFMYTLAGKLLKYLFIALAGFYGSEWVKSWFSLSVGK